MPGVLVLGLPLQSTDTLYRWSYDVAAVRVLSIAKIDWKSDALKWLVHAFSFGLRLFQRYPSEPWVLLPHRIPEHPIRG